MTAVRMRPGIRSHRRCVRATVRRVAVGLCIAAAPALHAQVPANAADSAALARQLVREGTAALRTGDTSTAHRRLVAASDAWPTQPAYLWTRAQLAAAARDTGDALAALTRYAALGMTRSIARDRFLSQLASSPRLSAIAAALDSNAAPIVRSRVRHTLSDSTLWPEGLAHDARTNRFFVASVRHRTVFVSDAQGTRPLWNGVRPDVGAVLGVQVDPDHRHLWATTAGIPQMTGYTPADSGIAALLKLRISDGAIVARWDLPPSADGHTLGDVAVSASGDVFTSDSREPVLYRLRPGRTVLEAYRSPLFRSLQGVAPAPDGAQVYVADYSHGLLRLDLATGAVTRLADAANATSLGVDGLVWFEHSLIGVQNGVAPARVVRFHFDPSGTRIVRQELLDRNSAIADEPTIGIMIGRTYVYVANSQWEKHDDAGARIAGTTLAPAVLLGLPVP